MPHFENMAWRNLNYLWPQRGSLAFSGRHTFLIAQSRILEQWILLHEIAPPFKHFNHITGKDAAFFLSGIFFRGKRISFTRARFTRDLMKLSVMGEVFWLFCASFFPLSKVFYFFGKEVFLLFMAMLVWWCMGRSVTGVYILLKIRDLYIADNSVER